MPITATIDRFEGDIAVLVVEPERTVVNVPRSDLPEGVGQGDVVRLEGTVDRDETNRRRAEIQGKVERLKLRRLINSFRPACSYGGRESCHRE